MSSESGSDISPTQGDPEAQGVSAITQIPKGRGPSKGVQVKKPMHLEYNGYNVPDGQWSKQYGKQVGSCAQRIDINVKEYRQVDRQMRQGFWEETKLMFHIMDDERKSREKYFHSCVAKRFRDFKSKLKGRWITKTHKPSKYPRNIMPWDVYHHITEADWAVFLHDYYTPESLAKSEKAKASASQNKNPHRTGQAGYIRKRQEWIQEGRLPEEAALSLSSSSSVNSSAPRSRKYRSKEWILAHQVRTEDGKWEISPTDEDAVQIARKIEEYIEEEEKGNLTFEDDEDALTKAFGKKDHRGRVKAMGGTVGYRAAFGLPKERRRRGPSEASSDLIESIRAEVRKEFESELDKRVAEALQKQLGSMLHLNQPNFTSTPVLGRSHVEAPYTSCPDSTPQPRELAERTPCHLALEYHSGNKVLVADGMVQPSSRLSSQHFTPMQPDHYKVQVDFVYDGHHDDILPVPTGDGFTNLGGAQGSFVQWPIRLVIFKDDEDYTTPRHPKKSSLSKKLYDSAKNTKSNKEVVGSCDRKTEESASKRKKAESDEVVGTGGHGPACKILQFVMSTAPGGAYDSTPIPLDASVWNYGTNQETYIAASDVEEFLKGECLNVSVIQVYMLYLLEEHKYAFENSGIGFICPETMSSTRIRANPKGVGQYLQNVFNNNSAKLLFLPYNQDNHWTLYVIDLFKGQIYLFDSLKGSRNSDVSVILNVGFHVYRLQGGRCAKSTGNRTKFTLARIECAQQSGGTECGYFVMKFMLDIVTGLFYDSEERLDQLYPKRNTALAYEEMDEVREQWAQYFTSKYLLAD